MRKPLVEKGAGLRWDDRCVTGPLRALVADANAQQPYGVVLGNYYQLIDVDTDGIGQEAHFGILHSDLTHKEGYDALRAMLATLERSDDPEYSATTHTMQPSSVEEQKDRISPRTSRNFSCLKAY